MSSDLERRYLDGLAKECATIEPLGGAPIPLEGVFVMLQALRSERPSPLQERPDLAPDAERHAHTGLRQREPDTPRPEREPAPPPPPVPLAQALRENLHLALLGEPGAGKSTALQYIALCFAKPGMAADKLNLREPRIPVRLTLHAVANHLDTAQLWGVGASAVAQLAGTTTEQAATLLDEWHNDGRLLLLLDGLDEVPADCREAVITAIRRYAATPEGQRSRIVVSSRLAGYQDLGAPYREFVLRPFADPAAALPFIVGWLAALREKPHPEVADEAQQVVAQFTRQPGLERLLDNPLLLQLALTHYVRSGQLEHNRAALYREYVEETAWERAVERLRPAAPPVTRAVALAALERVAWTLHTRTDCNRLDLEKLLAEKLPEAGDPDTLLAFLRQPLGLLAAYELDGAERLAFGHLTFQEYLVAAHLARAWKADRRRTWRFLKPRLHAAAWREPLLLLAAGLGKATETLVRRVKCMGSPYERMLQRDLFLAITLAQEAGQLDDPDDRVRTAGAAALHSLRDSRVVEPLIGRLDDSDSDMRRAAAAALRSLGDPRAVEPLIDHLDDPDPDVRRAVAAALDSLGDLRAVEPLIGRLDDYDWHVQEAAAAALGSLGDLRAVLPLISRLDDDDWHVQEAAAAALRSLGDTRAVEYIIGRLDDDDWHVQEAAAAALPSLGDTRAVEHVIGRLNDPDSDRRRAAAAALGRLDDTRAVEPLIGHLEDVDERVSRAAAAALGSLGDTRAVEPLIAHLADPDLDVRRYAAEALGRLGDARAAEPLIGHLADPDLDVRRYAADALGRLGDTRAVKPLIDRLNGPDPDVRRAVAAALGRLGDTRAVKPLIDRLNDPDPDVRRVVAAALGRLEVGSYRSRSWGGGDLVAPPHDRTDFISLMTALGLGDNHSCLQSAMVSAPAELVSHLDAHECRAALRALWWAAHRPWRRLPCSSSVVHPFVDRLTELCVAALPPTDPLDTPVTLAWRKRALWISGFVAVTVLGFAHAVLQDVAKDALKSELAPELVGPVFWASLAAAALTLAVLVGLAKRWLDRHQP